MILRLAHVLDPGHPVHQGMVHFGEQLSVLSGGSIRVDIYPSGQLGNERECLELVQLGGLDMAKVSSSVIENFVPAMAVFSLPYLFNDADHYWKVFNSEVGKEILAQGKPFLLHGLCFYDAGFRSFFVREKSIHEPDDLKGMKIRVTIDFAPATSVIAQRIATGLDSFTLLAIPFFILAGNIMGHGGIARRLIEFARALVGSFPGGLAYFLGLSFALAADFTVFAISRLKLDSTGNSENGGNNDTE